MVGRKSGQWHERRASRAVITVEAGRRKHLPFLGNHSCGGSGFNGGFLMFSKPYLPTAKGRNDEPCHHKYGGGGIEVAYLSSLFLVAELFRGVSHFGNLKKKKKKKEKKKVQTQAVDSGHECMAVEGATGP